jgi:aldehyde dehydrogenase (NAD+)
LPQLHTNYIFDSLKVFENVNADAKIVKEEIFGPVVVVTKFTSEEDLLKVANNSVYGLAAAVFSRDISRAMNIANKLQALVIPVRPHRRR